MNPARPISARDVAILIADGDGLLLFGIRFGIMLRLVFVFFTDPAESLTSKPNNSHKLRPNLDEQLNSGRNSLLYETIG